MDGVGQTGSDRQGDHADDGGINGHSSPWSAHRAQEWSSAGAALEPAFETLSPWGATNPDRRGIEALSGGDNPDDALTSTLVQPRYTPFSSLSSSFGSTLDDALEDPLGDSLGDVLSSSLSSEDPYADELAQRSAEFARHAALDDPTPAQGLPHVGAPPVAWKPPDPDPPLAQMTLGQRFGMAFPPAADEEPATDPYPTGGYPRLSGEWRSVTPQASAQGEAETLERFQSGFTVATPSQPDSDAALDDDQIDAEDRFGRDLFRRESPFNREAFKRDNPFGVETETGEDLPQRIPAEPDVPRRDDVLGDASLEDKEAQLTRIASHLRRDDVPSERPDGFDVEAVLEAVRGVAGVREATLRTTSTGARHLRLELSEGADPGTISRMVARMLQDQMGINAALTGNALGANPLGGSPLGGNMPGAGQSGPTIPGQAEPTGDGTPPVVLPGPRTGLGAAPPPAVENPPSLRDRMMGARDTRRRHPVSVPRRPPSELRPSERAAAAWRAGAEGDPGSMPPAIPTDRDQGPRPIVDHVQTSTFGLDATVEVRLTLGDKQAVGVSSGPAVDAFILRLSAAATAAAIDDLLRDGTTIGEPGRCFVEHAAIVPMGSCDVAVVVVLLMCGGWVEQLAGSALVSGDPRRAVVRATLSAVNRRLAALLP